MGTASTNGQSSHKNAHKRTRDQVLAIRSDVARWKLMGETVASIRDLVKEKHGLELSRSTIIHDINMIRREWRELALDDYEEHYNRESARLDLLESKAWDEYAKAETAKYRLTALNTILNIQKDRRRMLGLYAPTALGLTINAARVEMPQKGYSDVSPDMWPALDEENVIDGEFEK